MRRNHIIITLLAMALWVGGVTLGQTTPPPKQATPRPDQSAIVAPSADQGSFAEAQKRMGEAAIAVELAKRGMDAATEHFNAIINKIRADNGWPESRFDAALNKDGQLTFSEKKSAKKE